MEEEKCQHDYMQCMKNQSSNLGTYTIDGCGEFITCDDGGLYCAACACHRSFHLKVPAARYVSSQLPPPLVSTEDQMLDKKRRARTKFTAEQKEKMGKFAEKIGWGMGKREREEGEEIERFLDEAGVSRRAFKVWMHNHRYISAAQAHQVDANSSGTETTDDNINVDVEMEVRGNNNADNY